MKKLRQILWMIFILNVQGLYSCALTTSISILKKGYFYVGGERIRRRSSSIIVNQMFVRRIMKILSCLSGRKVTRNKIIESKNYFPVEEQKINNPFASKTALRYAEGRPNIHIEVMGKIINFLNSKMNVTPQFDMAVDVGCGTGLSTIALTPISRQVIGVDPSEDMLKQAKLHPKVKYQKGVAESLFLEDNVADIMTIASAFHWVNQQKFLGEARRVLKNKGVLIIYDNRFMATMVENPEFSDWFNTDFLARYPTPPRYEKFNPDKLKDIDGLRFIGEEKYTNLVSLNLKQLINYLTTFSNIISKIENSEETLLDVEAWLNEQLSSLFADKEESKQFLFGGEIQYLQKLDT